MEIVHGVKIRLLKSLHVGKAGTSIGGLHGVVRWHVLFGRSREAWFGEMARLGRDL